MLEKTAQEFIKAKQCWAKYRQRYRCIRAHNHGGKHILVRGWRVIKWKTKNVADN